MTEPSAKVSAGPQAAPAWSSTGLRWIGRLSAATAVVLFVLVVVAVHRERLVHDSTNQIVATFRVNNSYFDQRVDFAKTDRIRDSAVELGRTLDEIQSAASADVQLLATTLPDATRLLGAAHDDLGTARDLPGIAARLHGSASNILETARHADNTVEAARTQLNSVADLVDQLNRELSSVDGKLALLPGTPATGRPDHEEIPR